MRVTAQEARHCRRRLAADTIQAEEDILSAGDCQHADVPVI